VKILLISDQPDAGLWDYYTPEKLKGIDMIISCGDLSQRYLEFLVTMGNVPLLYVHGNHDDRFDAQPPEGCHCIDGDVVKVNGLRILGLGGSMRYKPGAHQYTEWGMRRRVIKLLPKLIFKRGFDILVTHAPAKGVGDSKDIAHRGFEVFITLMKWFKPKFLLHGHVHKEYSHEFVRERKFEGTRVINAWMSYVIEIEK
jgi:Icc-related predicted phosphoesterase